MAKSFTLPSAILDEYTCRGSPIVISYPFDAAIKTPFVTMTLRTKGNNKVITIGNKSYIDFAGRGGKVAGKDASAYDRPFIKSFRYGFTDSASVEIVLVDSIGGKFGEFLQYVPQGCPDMQINNEFVVYINFGWIYQSCNGDVKLYDLKYTQNIEYIPHPDDPKKRTLPFNPGDYELSVSMKQIQISKSNGLWTYAISMSDITTIVKREESLKSDKDTPGTDENKVKFTDAIDSLMQPCGIKKDNKAYHTTMRISTRNAGNAGDPNRNSQIKVLEAFGFKASDGGATGPPNIYAPNNENSLDVIRSYANELVTDKKNGMYFLLDAKSRRPYLYIVEDQRELIDKAKKCVKQPLATYVVNGGDYSPVLAFDISVGVNNLSAIGGVGPNPTSAKIDPAKDGEKPSLGVEKDDTEGKNAFGVETFIPISPDVTNHRAPSVANQATYRAIFQNSLASQVYESTGELKGSLILIGDPYYANSLVVQGETLSIIYLEPFSPGNVPGTGCEYSISKSNVNKYISNRTWTINGVSHEITEDGKFTTIIEVVREPDEVPKK